MMDVQLKRVMLREQWQSLYRGIQAALDDLVAKYDTKVMEPGIELEIRELAAKRVKEILQLDEFPYSAVKLASHFSPNGEDQSLLGIYVDPDHILERVTLEFVDAPDEA